jgi:hypothetical protein
MTETPTTETLRLSPFFERAEGSTEGFPADSYVAGYREPRGTTNTVEITLPGELVERAVLTDSCLEVSLSPDGRLALYGEGLSDAAVEVASSAVRRQTLETLVAGSLNPELLAGEDDAIGDLTMLRGQLVRALAQLDDTLERLKQR